MENAGYLFAAFAIVWGAVFGYVLVLMNRQAKLHQEIASLKNELREMNALKGAAARTGSA